jgi:hypothetical protein
MKTEVRNAKSEVSSRFVGRQFLDCAGRAQRRRRFRVHEWGSINREAIFVRKRCRALLATAVHDALCPAGVPEDGFRSI